MDFEDCQRVSAPRKLDELIPFNKLLSGPKWNMQARLFYGNRLDVSELLRKPQKGASGIKKSRPFPKGAWPWTLLEGIRCFGNQSPFVLDPLAPDMPSSCGFQTRDRESGLSFWTLRTTKDSRYLGNQKC